MDIRTRLTKLENQYWISIDTDWYDMAFKISMTALADLADGVDQGEIKNRIAESYMSTWAQRSEFCLEEVKEQTDSLLFETEH